MSHQFLAAFACCITLFGPSICMQTICVSSFILYEPPHMASEWSLRMVETQKYSKLVVAVHP